MTNPDPRRNIEIKARVSNGEALLAAVYALPARDAGVLHQLDTYFGVPSGRLKLREIDGAASELIYYSRPDAEDAKRSDYRIVPVAEAPTLKLLLAAALGVRGCVEKTRRLFLYRHTRIHLDLVAGLGEFLELETVLEAISEEAGRAECAEVVRALGIRPEELCAESYIDMVV
jgi:predicted adenylyl cyclase CyaB